MASVKEDHAEAAEQAEADENSGLLCAREIVIGSYEHVIYGIGLQVASSASSASAVEVLLHRSFATEAHGGGITAMAASGSVVVSGSADELLKVYDMLKHIELGTLVMHTSTVSCVDFYQNANMLSGAEDGSICIWDAQSWDSLKVMRGHKGAVNDLAVHPSGKLALSVGRDRSLRIWNLMSGRCAYITMRPVEPTQVGWLPSGDGYYIGAGTGVHVYSTATSEIVASCTLPDRVMRVRAISDDVVVAGGWDGRISIISAAHGGMYASFAAHNNRIKCLEAFLLPEGYGAMVVSGDADGSIKVWHIQQAVLEQSAEAEAGQEPTELNLVPVASERISSRLTCMCLADPAAPRRKIKTALKRMEQQTQADPKLKDAVEQKAQAAFKPTLKNAPAPEVPLTKKAKARLKAKEDELRFDEVPVESAAPIAATEGLYTPADAEDAGHVAGMDAETAKDSPRKKTKGGQDGAGNAKRSKKAAGEAGGQGNPGVHVGATSQKKEKAKKERKAANTAAEA